VARQVVFLSTDAMSGDPTKAERAEFDCWLESTAKAKPRDAEFSQAERELHHAWDLVTAGIKYTKAEVSRLDPQRQRIAQLVNALCIWRAGHRASDEAQASYEELKARVRQRRRRFREFEWMVRARMLHPERVPKRSGRLSS
jgi:hypothetical protein